MRRVVALLLPAALLIAACSPTAVPSPSSSPAAPPSPIGSPAPVGTPAPVVSPSPAETPAPSITPEEEALMGALRLDAAINCVPRRTDLPVGALRGIECRPVGPLVARIGIYAFPSANEAAYAYMTRLADAGVDVNAGDCNRDLPGDAPWLPGDNEGEFTDPGVFNWENSVLSPARTGCFADVNGMANVRATCDAYYIGMLGAGTDLSELYDWAWTYPQGYEPGAHDAPGICVGDGLIVPDAP